jgi:hypothetical protein
MSTPLLPRPVPLATNLNCNRIDEHEGPLERMLVVLRSTFSKVIPKLV